MIKNVLIREWYARAKDKRRAGILTVMGVDYAHLRLKNGDDLYVTEDGLPFIDNLDPSNFWTDREWFSRNSHQLSGTSSVYRVRTKAVNGISREIVVKWNRMGQDIPGAATSNIDASAEFNSPFEELSLVYELRREMYRSPSAKVVQKPLAIYVPAETADIERTGRRKHVMQTKVRTHSEVVLDVLRSYAVIYEWIKGVDAVQAFQGGHIEQGQMEELTRDAERTMGDLGFVVHDNKPHHVIVRPRPDDGVAKNRNGETIYALVDFELLARNPERQTRLKKEKREEYLRRQRDRFRTGPVKTFHPHMHTVNIMGVTYMYATVPSTKGRLWVVGEDPHLFDYFLPERWENTPRTKISLFSDMYHTVTKDNIHLVWKLSSVGLRPDMDPFKRDERALLEHGYNSPFEEVSLAIELSKKGVPSVYPRAIYMSGSHASVEGHLSDNSRYETHKRRKTPDGLRILGKNRTYVTIWGYWNGPDERLAARDGDYYEGVDALRACREGSITHRQYLDLLNTVRKRLRKAGVEDMNLRGNHILISFDSRGRIVRGLDGAMDVRICNFEFLKRIKRRPGRCRRRPS